MPLYKLEDGTSSVMIDPTRGLDIPENRIRQHIRTKQGTPDTYEFGNAEKYDIPLINLPKAKQDQLMTWWLEMQELTFTPNQASVSATIQMMIDGIERPLNMWHHRFKSKYAGTIRLCEVSSQSISSSQVSVSRSRSCSTFDASESGSVGFSRTCSLFLFSVAHQESCSVILVDASFSASISTSCSVTRSCSTFSFSVIPGFITHSACADSTSCGNVLGSVSASQSGSESCGQVGVSFLDSSCEDVSTFSFSESAGGISCSVSEGGIS